MHSQLNFARFQLRQRELVERVVLRVRKLRCRQRRGCYAALARLVVQSSSATPPPATATPRARARPFVHSV